jgi:anti-sigma regulatory factor (Ser/Thr protein kinase)
LLFPDICAKISLIKAALGIFLVKKTMDRVSYEYSGGANVLTLEKKK